MLILLPPSEGKRPPASGLTLDLGRLAHPGLSDTRRSVLDALVATSGLPDAAARLGVPPGAAERVRANTRLREAPCAPAGDVYAGVLYDALGLDALPAAARARANASLLIFSALFGVLAPDDPIPAYRASACSRLVGLGAAKAVWRSALRGWRPDDPFVLDARSGDYASFAAVPGAHALRVVTIRDGRRVPVSHWAKQARGHAARLLLLAADAPRTLADAVDAVNDHSGRATMATAAGAPVRLRAEAPGDGSLTLVVG